jgi:diaminopimelate epimerase
MEVMSEHEVKLRVFERGAGETLGCGSGACAAVAVGRQWQILAPSVKVHMPGGTLSIAWQGGRNKIEMTGPAIRVFEGSAHLSL